jgi:succinate dehydrogenase / fumarate reductase, cytochrome b subunit
VQRAAENAPRFLTLWKIRFPVGAIASIAHRISGVLLLLALPLLAIALESSVRGPADYAQLLDVLRSRAITPVVVLIVWAIAHHVFAGIRGRPATAHAGLRIHARLCQRMLLDALLELKRMDPSLSFRRSCRSVRRL